MKPFILCFVGTSGSGKTTLANAVAEILSKRNMKMQVIDGDILRDQLGNLFGYTREERLKQNQVVKVITKYLFDQEINVILAIVAPYQEMRTGMRRYFGEGYIEMYVKCSYEVCAQRDVKGYYKLQKQGRMRGLNGADDVFETPQDVDLILDTSKTSVDGCVEQVTEYLRKCGYVV